MFLPIKKYYLGINFIILKCLISYTYVIFNKLRGYTTTKNDNDVKIQNIFLIMNFLIIDHLNCLYITP